MRVLNFKKHFNLSLLISLYLGWLFSSPIRADHSPQSDTRDPKLFIIGCSIAKALNDPTAVDRCGDIGDSRTGERESESSDFPNSGSTQGSLPAATSRQRSSHTPPG